MGRFGLRKMGRSSFVLVFGQSKFVMTSSHRRNWIPFAIDRPEHNQQQQQQQQQQHQQHQQQINRNATGWNIVQWKDETKFVLNFVGIFYFFSQFFFTASSRPFFSLSSFLRLRRAEKKSVSSWRYEDEFQRITERNVILFQKWN